MALVLPDQGEAILLSLLVNKTSVYTQQDLKLRLYKSNTTPGESDTEATYTEADFTGYSNISMTGSSWTVSTTSGVTTAEYPQQTFTSSAASQNQSIYGYYVTQSTSGKLVYAERFADGPYVVNNDGDAIKITAKITAD